MSLAGALLVPPISRATAMGLTCSKSAFDDTSDIIRVGSEAEKSCGTPRTESEDIFEADDELAATAVRDQGVVVLVRVRPKSSLEHARAQRSGFLRVQSPTQLHVPASKATPTEKTCSFDAVLPETTSQEEVYQVAGPKLLRNVLQGFNATMIAYGQTGSGKTFTMEGTPQDPGVTPRLCRGLFEAIGKLGPEKEIAVVASFVEVYQENIRDLLEPSGAQATSGRKISPQGSKGSTSLFAAAGEGGGALSENGGAGRARPSIRENKEGVYVEHVTSEKVTSEAEVLALLARGSCARSKGETQMNAVSSRSHAVLTLSITQTPVGVEERGGDGDRGGGREMAVGTIRSKISLVDLAGSERAKSTGAAGQRLKEGAQINKSLSALGNVIQALTSGSNAHVPFRDSKLTRLLQDSLGGTAYTVVCCNVSPIEASEPETLSTLRFAERLKKVRNKMVVHMDARSKEMLALKRANADLRARVEYLEGVLAESAVAGAEGSSQVSAASRRGAGCSSDARKVGNPRGFSRAAALVQV